MTTVEVGRVTGRKNARLHLMLDGRADCPTVRGRHATGKGARPVRADDATKLCLRCRPAIIAAVDAEQARAAGSSVVARINPGLPYRLAALADALRTDADRAADQRASDAFRAQFNAIIAESLADMPTAAPAAVDDAGADLLPFAA